jgi:hypothetical protein
MKQTVMTDQSLQQTILKELRSLRGSFDAHAADAVRRLNNLETQMDRVLDPETKLRRFTRRALAQ